jgi:hypothetical protein
MSKQNEQEKREKIHTVRPAGSKIPEELQLHHNHERFLFLTVLFLFAQCLINYWWLVTWLDLFCSLYSQDQDTRLRMSNKWRIWKEGLAGNKKNNCLCFLNYLAFLRPAADRAVSIQRLNPPITSIWVIVLVLWVTTFLSPAKRHMAWFKHIQEVKSSYLSPIIYFALCTEQQHSQKQDNFVIMV